LRIENRVVAKNPRKPRIQGWLAAFLVIPLSVWLTVSLRTGFHEKSLSNKTLEPSLVVLLSVAVFAAWYLVARKGLRPFVGITLLILLSAVALAVQQMVPSLRE
jgi:cytochrome bd-type quinol oxidase subunit 2